MGGGGGGERGLGFPTHQVGRQALGVAWIPNTQLQYPPLREVMPVWLPSRSLLQEWHRAIGWRGGDLRGLDVAPATRGLSCSPDLVHHVPELLGAQRCHISCLDGVLPAIGQPLRLVHRSIGTCTRKGPGSHTQGQGGVRQPLRRLLLCCPRDGGRGVDQYRTPIHVDWPHGRPTAASGWWQKAVRGDQAVQNLPERA